MAFIVTIKANEQYVREWVGKALATPRAAPVVVYAIKKKSFPNVIIHRATNATQGR